MKRLFPRICLCGSLIISFLFLPINSVYADGYSSDADFWRWWYIENTTNAITDGQGASAENIQDTDSGQTAGTVIYNQSGVTRGDLIDYVEEQYNQAEGYLQRGVDYYVNAINNVYDSTVTAATKASYETQKAVREVVDSTGNVIVDVSGSDFWHSVYNDLFNSNSYERQYTTTNDAMSGTSNGHNYTISFVGFELSEGLSYSYQPSVVFRDNLYLNWQYRSNEMNAIFKITDENGTYYSLLLNTGYYSPSDDLNNKYTFEGFLFSNSYIRATFSYIANGNKSYFDFYFKTTGNNTGVNTGTAVQQPYSVGFINYNGEKKPIYTDKDLNDDLTVNDNGTVTDGNGNEYPIYVDPSELTDDGWLKILEYIDNNDTTENPYNPQGKPWNTQPDGTAQGGLFSNLIKDISSLFTGLGDILKGLIDKIIKAFAGIVDFIVDGLKKFFNAFLDFDTDIFDDIEIDNNFGVITELYHTLLEILGVE